MLLSRQAQKLLDDLSPLSLVLEHTLGEDIQSVLNSIRRENQGWIHGIASSGNVREALKKIYETYGKFHI